MNRSEREKWWEARMASFKANGESPGKWCAAHGIKPHQLYDGF